MATLSGSLHLTRAQIAEYGNPATNVTAGTAGSAGGGGSRVDDRSVTGEFRQYANGVTRLILGTAKSRNLNITLRALPPGDVTRLRALMGKLCVFRDTYGRVVFGSFTEIQETTIPLSSTDGTANTTMSDCSFVFVEITASEVV